MSIYIAIPNRPLNIDVVCVDFNGTLAVDGQLLGGVKLKLRELAGHG